MRPTTAVQVTWCFDSTEPSLLLPFNPHCMHNPYLYNSWYARESSELIGGCLAVRGREAVQQCRLKEKEGREEERGRRRGEVMKWR